MSILILGGAGFIGCNWANWLLQQSSATVHIFDSLTRRGSQHNLNWLKSVTNENHRLRITIGDIRDIREVELAVQGATEIYHFAAQVAVTTSIEDPRLDFDVNLLGTLNVLEAVRKRGESPLILFTSTNKVYGSLNSSGLFADGDRHRCKVMGGATEALPLDFYTPYGCSKGAADQYVRDYARVFGLRTIVFRMSCIAGAHQFGNEDQGWVAHFLFSALRNSPITIYGDGMQVRDVLCVDDLVRAFAAARQLQDCSEGHIYNIGGGPHNAVSLLELLSMIEHITACRIKPIFSPSRLGDQRFYVTDHSRFSRDTGWEPTLGVDLTLERVYQFWTQNRDLFPPSIAGADVLTSLPG
jgi:CDP-paratose 2-epimerase